MSNFQGIWTYNLSGGSITINGLWGLNTVSILVTSGTTTVTGTINAGGNASTAISLTTSTGPITIGGGNGSNPLDGVVISGGTAIIIGYN